MKFLHAADIHLDSPLQNIALDSPEEADRLRRATREAFEALVDLALAEEVRFLLLAGDLYDHDTPNMQIALFLRNQLLRLARANIRVVIVRGNHDAANKITSALDLPGNTTVLSSRSPQTVEFPEWEVAITGQSFTEGPVTTNLARGYPEPRPGRFNIAMLHTSLQGSEEHDVYAPCTLADLTFRPYQYWALGHIHKGAILSRDPYVVYPGNLQGRHARETGPKGAMLVEFEGSRVLGLEFRPLDVVRWHQVAVDLTGRGTRHELAEALRTGLSRAILESEGRPAIVRLLLSGESSLASELARSPESLRQTVLELAGELAGDLASGGLWIEKIKNATTLPAKKSKRAALPDDDLRAILEEIVRDPSSLAAPLEKELSPLAAKLPEDLREPVERLLGQGEDLPEDLSRLFASLLPRLESRLYPSED